MTATARLSDRFPETLARMWWAVLLRGLAVIVFGVLAFFWLGKSLGGLASLFTVYAVVDGLLAVVGAIRAGGLEARRGLALAGLVSIAAGVATALWPGITWPALVTIIGVWAIARGGLELASALQLRKVMFQDWSLAGAGGLSIVFGVLPLLNRGIDPWTFVRLLSVYSLVLGLLFIVLAIRFVKPPR